ncbi:MAG: phosphate ABC transporter permease subunit PstC [Rhodospirillaceae bacterium]|nr:phosphate ABC transporter permease subunit PstC [Rhodospirillaceae bacterium]
MPDMAVLVALLALSAAAYQVGRRRALAAAGPERRALHSLPGYHGLYVALWCAVPGLVILVLWLAVRQPLLDALVLSSLPPDLRAAPPGRLGLQLNDIRNVASGVFGSADKPPEVVAAAARLNALRRTTGTALALVAVAASLAGLVWAQRRVSPRFRARNAVERATTWALLACALVSIVTTLGIVLSLVFEAGRFFAAVSPLDFLFGLHWSPQLALRPDQVGSSGAFGAVPVFAGTLLITLIAMLVAVPVGLLSAVYMSEYASRRVRGAVKPLLEVLAGVPTVVYGFFAALIVAPSVRRLGEAAGLDVASESALAAGVVMGVMIIPFVSSLSDDVINAVPQTLRDGSYALGATRSETIRRVVLPAALPGIVGAVLLAVSRAIGETMIVVMAAGLTANLTANPFEAVTTVTVQIVTLLVGDQEFDSPKTLAAFALGLVLFCATLALNVVALKVVRRYRERYE